MKKLTISIFIILILLVNILSPSVAISASTRFGRIIGSTEIYKNISGNNNISNILCIAEETYFVEIIGDYDEYYRVNYNGISGYIKSGSVKEISGTPTTPYPYNIKIVIGNNCNLRSTPTTTQQLNNIVCTLHSGEENITFIGRIYSEEAIDFGGTTWYYVNYNGYYGYVYNKYIKSISPIYHNTESVAFLSATQNTITNPITHTPSLIIIIILLIPCLGILLILYFPKRQHQKQKPRKSPKIFDRY